MVLTLDCDMSSNDPQTPLRVLCYISDPATRPNLSFVQFPQRFRGLSKNDIYASEFKRLFLINFLGMDGLKGPNYVGTGAFFCRRSLFGSPSTLISPEIPQLHPNHVVDKDKPIHESPAMLSLAHHVAGCNYENQTKWGSKVRAISIFNKFCISLLVTLVPSKPCSNSRMPSRIFSCTY